MQEQKQNEEFFIVPEEESGIRIDLLLKKHFQSKSRTYFQYLIEEGFVLLNGKKIKKREIVKAGEEIEVFFALTPEISLSPENIPLDILYEDEDILAINKPAGMVVHPAAGNWSSTFVNALLFYCKNIPLEEGSLRPGIVHRLDKDTSGVLLAAKNKEAQEKLILAFSERKVHKEYLAVSFGSSENFKNQSISAPIGRHPQVRQKMAIVASGKPAVTDFSLLSSSRSNEKLKDGIEKNLLLILAKPQTGRTHQIRLHLQSIKAPILGDPLYGHLSINEKFSISRQFLHARKISFLHPLSQMPIEITAPLPEDMKTFIDKYFSINL
jgi:23S rRNA pseudouridine1911/1915/1917 synthase